MNRIRRKIIQLHKVCRQRRDNRGSAIVIVIIAMAMIGILATTLLWMAYMNYMIKVADVRNKNSFYSAEEVVEQIMAGLQHTTADAVGVAYRDVMANWESLGTEDNRYNTFATTYMDTLIEELKSPTEGSGFYNRDKLKSYVDAGIFQESTDTKGVNKTAWNNGGPVGEGLKRPEMEMVNNNSIILHNIYVSYTDDQNRVSIVQTDICIDVPKLIFENSGSIDGLYEYSLIGNSGIEVSGPGGTTTVEGSIFAGMDAVTGDGGLLINPANSLALDNARRVIAKGDIVVKGPASALVVRDMPGEDNRVYAQNITLESGTVSLDCKTYVANDLSLNGSGSKATLTKEYYGYGASTYNARPGEPQDEDGKWQVDSSASSAIIINGKNSTVDMAGVKRLLLAGRSYIGQASTMAEAESYRQEIEAGTRVPSVPVMMGESIAVKGGQIAYLVPAECIGTVDGETVIGQNPINGEKENDIKEMLKGNESGAGDAGGSGEAGDADASGEGESSGVFHEVDFNKKVYRLGGKSLSEFGVTKMEHIRKVYAPYKGGNLLYYYLVMDKKNAEQYFVQYYNFNANKESIDRYFNTYASGGILLGDFEASDTQYTILGNSLVSRAASASGVGLLTSLDQTTLNPDEGEEGTPGEGEGTEKPPADPDAYTETGENAEKMPNDEEEADVLQLSADIADIYRALTFNLTEDASLVPSDPELAKDYYVFNSVIREKDVKKYLDDNHYGNTVIYETDSGLQAILTRDPLNVSNIDDKTRLIISYSDVNVDKNFTGLIIAKGKITINPSVVVSIKQNKMDLYKVLEAKHRGDDDDTITPIDMFVHGGGSMLNGAEAPTVDDAGNLIIDYGEIVRYMNWIKK